MSSVSDLFLYLLFFWVKVVEFFQKIPVLFTQRRDQKNFLTPSKGSTPDLHKTPSNENCAKKVLSAGEKYKHVHSKINTHWSPEERQRSGLRTFFERKQKSPAYKTSLSPEIMKQVSRVQSSNRRQSLPAQSTHSTYDPISVALDNIRKNTVLNSYSSCSSSNSSFVSLPESSIDNQHSE